MISGSVIIPDNHFSSCSIGGVTSVPRALHARNTTQRKAGCEWLGGGNRLTLDYGDDEK